MKTQKEFMSILYSVKSEMNIFFEKNFSKCKYDILRDETDCYRVILELDNCMGEILVDQPLFAPYRYFKFEVYSSVEDKPIYIWYDRENNSVEEILYHLREGLEIALYYN